MLRHGRFGICAAPPNEGARLGRGLCAYDAGARAPEGSRTPRRKAGETRGPEKNRRVCGGRCTAIAIRGRVVSFGDNGFWISQLGQLRSRAARDLARSETG